MTKVIHFIHIIVLGLVFIAAGYWLTDYLLGTLEGPISPGSISSTGIDFEDILSQTDVQIKRRLGEWEFSEPKLEGHFHHIGRWYQRDSWNFCIECHGPTPHARSTLMRAFLNMHSLFVSCQVCHVRRNEDAAPTRFGWVELTDGQLSPNPRMEGIWGEYGVKIIQLAGSDSDPVPLDLDEERNFSFEFIKRSSQLDERQRVIGNKLIHKRCTDEPVQCTLCHTTANAFLPFDELGYSEERIDFLVKPEVVDLVQRYETFFIPSLLEPEEIDSVSESSEQQ